MVFALVFKRTTPDAPKIIETGRPSLRELGPAQVRVAVGKDPDADAGPEANVRITQTVEVCEQKARDGKLFDLLRTRYVGRADASPASRGGAAAGTWIFRESRRRRGCDAESP